MTGMISEQPSSSNHQPNSIFTPPIQHTDIPANPASPNNNSSQFDSSEGQKLATYIDHSLERSTKYFAKELEAYHEQGETRRRDNLVEAVNFLKAAMGEMRDKITEDDTKASQDLVKAMERVNLAVNQLNESQVDATKKAERAHFELLEEIRRNHAETMQGQAEMRRIQEESGNELRENKGEVMKAQVDCQATIVHPSLIVAVSLDNGDPIGKYAHYQKPIDVELGQAHNISEIVTLINQAYSRPAQTTPDSGSTQFDLVCITIPGETGESDGRGIMRSGRWTAWVQNVLVHKDAQVKVEMVFKMGRRDNRASKKRKLDDSEQAKMGNGDEADEGRNLFRAYNW